MDMYAKAAEVPTAAIGFRKIKILRDSKGSLILSKKMKLKLIKGAIKTTNKYDGNGK